MPIKPGNERDHGVLVETSKPEVARPPLYSVLLLNDDYTPMEFVVEVLVRFFAHEHREGDPDHAPRPYPRQGRVRRLHAGGGRVQSGAGERIFKAEPAPAVVHHGEGVNRTRGAGLVSADGRPTSSAVD